jgi:peptidoglycan hydrolase-like protein with peptidoglycan-binding domain
MANNRPELKYGSSGDDVKELQRTLNAHGYNLTVDGVWGDNTDAAVRKYQKQNGLTVDGIVGANTWGSLIGGNKTTPTTPTEPKSYSGIDMSKYDSGYQKSDDVIAAEKKKTEMENAVNNYGDFKYSDQSTLDEVMNKILNREQFSYDLNGDALYQQYKDKYIQQGKMAMQDTMGQAAAMTGGYGNSYAASVGNQAYQAQLNNLNDIVPELYQMAYDKYNQEGQELYNQYGLLSDDRNTEYGLWGDKYNQLVSDRDYYGNEAKNAYVKDYGEYNDSYNRDFNQYWNDTNFGYGQERDSIADKQWQAQFDEAKRQYNEQFEYQKAQAEKAASSGSGGRGSGETESNTLWYATGTYDANGNPVYRNTQGKTQSFGEGVNPYTGTKHADAKHGTFSNGYQPDNISGTKLEDTGISTNVTGENQTVWKANGKYWLWRGDLNKYIEVDISELD